MRILRNKLGIDLPIRTEKNFPVQGMEFIDIVPILLNKEIFDTIIKSFIQKIKEKNLQVDYILGPESRGFLFGPSVAKELGVGFKEYGLDRLSLPKLSDGTYENKKIYIIDDIYATGNTVKAIKDAVKELGGEVVGTGVVINIVELNHDRDMFSILDVNEEA